MSVVQLHQWQLDKSTGVLTDVQSGQQQRLEAQQVDLLCYLIERQSQVISRDELAERIWPNVIVEDNTISKAITRLRKVLQDDSRQPRFIQTIPKKGYRLIAPVSIPQQSSAEPDKRKVTPFLRQPWLYLLMVGFAVLFWWLNPPEVGITTYHIQPLTSEDGREINGTIAPDGKQWAAVVQQGDEYFITIYQRDNEKTRQWKVSSGAVVPNWSPDGKHLLFSDINPQKTCQFFLLKPQALLSVTPVLDCPHNELSRGKWQPNSQGFYFTSAGQAYHYSLNQQQLSTLPFESVLLIQPSANGRSLALVNEATLTPDLEPEVHIVRADDYQTIARLPLTHPLRDLIWAQGDQALIYPGQHPSTELLQQDLNGKVRVIASAPFGYIEQVSDLGANGEIIATSSYIDRDIVRQTNGQQQMLVNSAYPDYNPRLAPKSNSLAFASKRSGIAQIWLREADGQLRQLSHFKQAHFIYQLLWSVDERKLLVKTRNALFYFDVASEQSTQLPLPEGNLRQFGWLNDDQVYLLSDNQLFLLTLSSLQLHKRQTDLTAVQFDGKHWYWQRSGQKHIMQSLPDFSQPKVALTLPEGLSEAKWQYQPWGWYLIDRSQQTQSLLFKSHKGSWQTLLNQPFVSFSGLQALSAESLLLTQTSSNEANIIALVPAK